MPTPNQLVPNQLAPSQLVQLKITSAICSFFALGSTLYRLYKRRARLWVDDLWALLASVALIIQVVAISLDIPPPNNLPKTSRVAVYYMGAAAFSVIIWASRLSILFSIFRLDPCIERRKRLFWAAAAFFAALLFVLAQRFWVCESKDSAWKNAPNPRCHFSIEVAICQLIPDIIADSYLLVAPLLLFRDLMDKALRRKLTLIFSTCVMTTIVSLVHAIFIILNGHIKILIFAIVEDCLSLIVANIPVVVTSMVDIVGDTDDPQSSRTHPFSSMFWEGTADRGGRTEGAIGGAVDLPLDGIGEEDIELSDTRTTKDTGISGNQNGPPENEGTVVDKVSSTNPVFGSPI